MNCDNCPYPIDGQCCHQGASADEAAWQREIEHKRTIEDLQQKATDKEKPLSAAN